MALHELAPNEVPEWGAYSWGAPHTGVAAVGWTDHEPALVLDGLIVKSAVD